MDEWLEIKGWMVVINVRFCFISFFLWFGYGEDCIAFFADCIILRNDVDGKGMGWSWMISVRVQGMMSLPNKQYERMPCRCLYFFKFSCTHLLILYTYAISLPIQPTCYTIFRKHNTTHSYSTNTFSPIKQNKNHDNHNGRIISINDMSLQTGKRWSKRYM